MSKNVKLELTPEQKKQIQEATGKDANVIEFSVEELEERIAPTTALEAGEKLEDRIAPTTVFEA